MEARARHDRNRPRRSAGRNVSLQNKKRERPAGDISAERRSSPLKCCCFWLSLLPYTRRYVARHFPPHYKAKAVAIVERVQAALARRLAQLDWLEPPTRDAAKAKMDAFGLKVTKKLRPAASQLCIYLPCSFLPWSVQPIFATRWPVSRASTPHHLLLFLKKYVSFMPDWVSRPMVGLRFS